MKNLASHNQTSDISIRTASLEDCALILEFIQRKADFDRDMGAYTGVLGVDNTKLQQTFNEHPFAFVLLGAKGGNECGFALYGFRYSSFAGQPSIWLDDLYVDPTMRSQGIGMSLMQQLTCIAKQHHCSHLGWTADARNLRGLDFYANLGAKLTQQYGNRCFWTWTP